MVSLPPFQSLLDAHGREVHRVLIAIVGRVDADDCYQETWVSALRAYPSLQDDRNLRAWVLTIAHRKAIDCLRSRARLRPTDGEVLMGLAEPSYEERILEDGGPLAAVHRLPDKQRAAVALRILLDADYPAVAATMGISEDAARRNVHEGLKKLREEYAR